MEEGEEVEEELQKVEEVKEEEEEVVVEFEEENTPDLLSKNLMCRSS